MNFSDIFESPLVEDPPPLTARVTAIIDALMDGELPPSNSGIPTTEELLDIIIGGVPLFNNDPPEDDPFWDSIKITVPIDDIPTVIVDNYECSICGNDAREVLKLPCCKGRMCTKCGINWFEKESSNCPFCKKDLRE